MTLPNPASEGLHRSLGFEDVGTWRRIGWKFGAWHDVLWMQRPARDRQRTARGALLSGPATTCVTLLTRGPRGEAVLSHI